MDPIVLAFGTALVGAIATSTWQQVRDAVTGLWRRAHPQQKADDIGTELDDLREQVLQARRDGDAGTEKALEGAWQLRLQQLLRADPALAAELRRVLDQALTPALTPAEQARIGTIIMTGSSHDSSTFTQIGTQVNQPPPLSTAAFRPWAELPVPPGLSNLPTRPGLFVGRAGELARLDAALAGPGGVVVQAVHGLGGIGKSTLAGRALGRRPRRRLHPDLVDHRRHASESPTLESIASVGAASRRRAIPAREMLLPLFMRPRCPRGAARC